MKSLKYFLMGSLMLSIGMPAAAQDSNELLKSAIQLVKNKATDKEVTAATKKLKKNAAALNEIGKVYYEQKDTANARKYAEMASKLKYGPAFVLLGDLSALADNGGEAAKNYEQAIYFDNKNAEAYRKYASVYRKVSPAGAVAKLEELRAIDPNYPVDALVGHIYYISNEFDRAIEAYDKVPQSKLEKMDIIESAFSSYLTQKYDKGAQLAKLGLEKEPRNSTLNRLAMFCNTELGNYDNALQYADALFNRSDSANLSYMDYVYFGNALNGNKQHEEAIKMFEKALDQEFDNKDKRAGVIKTLADAHKSNQNFPEALKYYEQYLNEVSKASANDYAGLGQLYVQYANTLEGEERNATFMKADGVYASLMEKYSDIEDYVEFQRARIGMYMDPESKQELAKPHYERLVELLSAKTEREHTDDVRLIEAYRYLISYYLIIKDDAATAKQVAAKLQAIDPENETAKQVLELK